MTDPRTLRKRLGLTQAELAAALGVSRWTIVQREAGRAPVNRETELAMAYLALTSAPQRSDGTPEPPEGGEPKGRSRRSSHATSSGEYPREP